MFVKNHMLEKDRLVLLEMDESLESALEKIEEGDFLSLPVMEDNKFQGYVLKSWIYKYYFDSEYDNKSDYLKNTKVRDVYHTDYKSILDNSDIDDAACDLLRLRTPFLPVFNRDHEFVGILTHKSIFRAFTELFGLGEGTKIVLNVHNIPGMLSKITEIISKENINIKNIASMDTKVMDLNRVVLRVNTSDVRRLITKLEESGIKVGEVSSN